MHARRPRIAAPATIKSYALIFEAGGAWTL